MRIEYIFYRLESKKEYCILCNEKTYEPYGLTVDKFEHKNDLQINIFLERKTIEPICYYCGMIILKAFDKINEE